MGRSMAGIADSVCDDRMMWTPANGPIRTMLLNAANASPPILSGSSNSSWNSSMTTTIRASFAPVTCRYSVRLARPLPSLFISSARRCISLSMLFSTARENSRSLLTETMRACGSDLVRP